MEPRLIPENQALQILHHVGPPPASWLSYLDRKIRQLAKERFQPQDILNATFTLKSLIEARRTIEPYEEAIESALWALGRLTEGSSQTQAMAILTQLSAQIETYDVLSPTLAHLHAIAKDPLSVGEETFFKNSQKLFGKRPLSHEEIIKFHELWQAHPAKNEALLTWSHKLLEARRQNLALIASDAKQFPFANLEWNRQAAEQWVEINAWAVPNLSYETRMSLQALLEQALIENTQIHADTLRLCTYPLAGETFLTPLERDRGLHKQAEPKDIRIIEGAKPLVLYRRQDGSPIFEAADWEYARAIPPLSFVAATRVIYFAHESGEEVRKAFATLNLSSVGLQNDAELNQALNFLVTLASPGIYEANGLFFHLWLTKEDEGSKKQLLHHSSSAPIREIIKEQLDQLDGEQQGRLLDQAIQFHYQLYSQMTLQKLLLGH